MIGLSHVVTRSLLKKENSAPFIGYDPHSIKHFFFKEKCFFVVFIPYD